MSFFTLKCNKKKEKKWDFRLWGKGVGGKPQFWLKLTIKVAKVLVSYKEEKVGITTV